MLTTTTIILPPASPETTIENTAIGNRIVVSFIIVASGFDDFTNKQVIVNFSPFQGTGIAAIGLGYESDGYVNGVLSDAVFVGSSSPFSFPLTQLNLKARFQKTSSTTCYCEIEFYMTMDVAAYVNANNYSNLERFLKSSISGSFGVNNGPSVYNSLKELGIKALVFDLSTSFSSNVVNATGSTTQRIKWKSRFYNSYFLGATTNIRYMSNIQITSPSQIASGVTFLTKATAAAPQPLGQSIDSAFNVIFNQLSISEKNTVAINLEGRALPLVTPNPTTTDIRVLLIRVSNLTNTVDFETDLLLNDAVIPALNATSTQLDGALWNPSAWVDVASETTDLTFTIDGSLLSIGHSYRIIVNMYDNVNDTVTSHISPEIIANFVPPITPTMTGEIGTYNKVYLGNEVSAVAPHSRFKSRLTISKTSFNSQIIALGIGGNFDDAFQIARCSLPLISGVTPQIRFYQKNTLALPANNQIITDGMVIVSNTATELVLDAFFRVVEELAGVVFQVNWVITFRIRTYVIGQNLDYQILFNQEIKPRLFENNELLPKLLSAKFYDNDAYPLNKFEVFDLCGRDFIICEIEKDAAFIGSINFAACIYPATATGDAALLSIEEEESWIPAIQILPQSFSPKLDNVDINFGADDFAAFRINLQNIPQLTQFWITGIAYEQLPSYCPIGLVQDIEIYTIRPSAVPFWALSASASNFVNEILAHPDYVSGVTIITHRVVDVNGILVTTQINSTTVIANDTLITILMPPQPVVYYQLIVGAIFDAGSGAHSIVFELNVDIPLMAVNAPLVSYDTNSYSCADLG